MFEVMFGNEDAILGQQRLRTMADRVKRRTVVMGIWRIEIDNVPRPNRFSAKI